MGFWEWVSTQWFLLASLVSFVSLTHHCLLRDSRKCFWCWAYCGICPNCSSSPLRRKNRNMAISSAHLTIIATHVDIGEDSAAAAKLLQLCPTLSDPMDCSPPGSSVHGIFQAVGCHCLVRAFLRDGNENWPFPVLFTANYKTVQGVTRTKYALRWFPSDWKSALQSLNEHALERMQVTGQKCDAKDK